MNYLLDTHTFIWAISERSKLSPIVRQTLDSTDNSIFVSAISFWEISLKFAMGKLGVMGALPEELPQLSLKTGFQIIPLSAEESSGYHKLISTSHKDPFDRMLIWQAIQRNYIFVTKDKSIEQYAAAGLKILW